MATHQDRTFQTLTIAYISALIFIAAVVAGSGVYLALATGEQRISAAVINVSGRQRMLSQRIALFARTYVASGDVETARQLESTARLMLAQHEALLNGDPSLGILKALPEDSRSLYFEAPHNLDTRVRAFTGAALELAGAPALNGEDVDILLKTILAEAKGPLLTSLDAAVTEFELLANAERETFARTEYFLVALQLAMLAALGVFLFRPIVQRIKFNTARANDRMAELDQKENRLSSILATLADGIVTIDEYGCITSINDAAELIFGYTSAELQGKNFWVLLPRGDQRGRTQTFKQLLLDGNNAPHMTNRDITGKRKSGEEFPMEVSFS